jgi:hypothetical protein
MNSQPFKFSDPVSNRNERNRRVLYGALSGLLTGTICAITITFINTWFYPDLPLYVSSTYAFKLWLLWAGMATVVAGISALSAENWSSILASAFLMALIILIINFLQSESSLALTIVMIMGLSLPFTAVMTPLAYIFFWLSRRFTMLKNMAPVERWKLLFLNGLVILGLGFLPGLYEKFDTRAETGVRLVHEMLQSAAQAPSADSYSALLQNLEGYAQHRDQPYTLSQKVSTSSTVGVDVTAHFEDGYELMCTVVLYHIENPNIRTCIVP